METFERSKLSPREADPFVRELLALRRTLPRRLDVSTDGNRVLLTRGTASLALDFDARTGELHA